jgi:hypothetical protein
MVAAVAAKILKRAKYTPKMKLTIIKANTEGSGPRMIGGMSTTTSQMQPYRVSPAAVQVAAGACIAPLVKL